MTQRQEEFKDPLIDEVRERRQKLLEKYGGMEVWFRHLQEEQRRNPPKHVYRKPSEQQANEPKDV